MLRRFTTSSRLDARLRVALALPLIAVVVLAVMRTIGLWQIAGEMDHTRQLAQLSVVVGDLVHELQTERGMSGLFLQGRGQHFAAELSAQRIRTDQRRDSLLWQARAELAAYPSAVQAAITEGINAAQELESRRRDVSAQALDQASAARAFTEVIAKLLAVPRVAVESSSDPAVTARALAYYGFLEAKERAGQERATGALGFNAGEFAPDQYQRFVAVNAAQQVFLASFEAHAQDEQRAFFHATVAGVAVADVERMRHIVIEAGPKVSLAGIAAADWFAAATARIDMMKAVEDRLAADLDAYAGAEAATAWRTLVFGAVVTIVIVLLSIVLAAWLARGIARSIARVVERLRSLSDGDTESPIYGEGRQDEVGDIAAAMVVFRDNLVKARDLQEAMARKEAEVTLREIIDTLPAAIHVCDAEERVTLWNTAYEQIFPRLVEPLRAGTTLEGLIHAGVATRSYGNELGPDAPEEERERWIANLVARIRSASAASPSREMALSDGRWLQARERRSPSGRLVCVCTDITRLKRAEAEARRRAEEDDLTRLLNRGALLHRLGDALNLRRASDEGGGCLALFDLDHFKAINDTCGHPFGDALLAEVGRRLRQATRQGDIVARLGGDEFALLLPGVAKVPDALQALERLRAELQHPFRDTDHEVKPMISLGVAFYPEDGTTVEALVSAADTALYAAKRDGRNRISLFDAGLGRRVAERRTLADRLHAALSAHEIEVALQPKIALNDGAVLGFEALARWTKDGVPVPPAEFVSVAEEHGLALDLGWRVLDAALASLRRLLDLGLEPGHFAVNCSTVQVLAPDAVERILDRLAAHGVPAARLELEVTENVLLDRSVERIDGALRRLADAGIGIALDDFGTGYASLTHLARFPINRLKIDRSFVSSVTERSREGMITRTIIALAKRLNLATVAEGVETREQLEFFQREGCDAVQGFLIAQPMSPDLAAHWLVEYSPGAYIRPPATSVRSRSGTSRRPRAVTEARIGPVPAIHSGQRAASVGTECHTAPAAAGARGRPVTPGRNDTAAAQP